MPRFVRSLVAAVKLAGGLAVAAGSLIVEPPRTRAARAQWLHRHAARLLRRLGVSVRQRGAFPTAGAIISNHLGYLEIIALAALHPAVFVSKDEVRRWPVIGWMATMAGTLFVRRGHGGSAARIRTDLCAGAADGVPIVFFPEGTTSPGTSILPFHSGLLFNAISCGLPVTAAHIRYRLAQDNGSATVETNVAYWGSASFLPHLFRLLGLRGVVVEIGFAGEPIAFSTAARLNRKLAAAEARDAVLQIGEMVGA